MEEGKGLERFFIISDFIVLSGFSLTAPIFAVFINDNIVGGTLEVIGISEMIYLLTRSLFQIPVANYVDRHKGERDDFLFLFFGSLSFSLIFIFYTIIETPNQLYLVQFLFGLISAFTLPSWYAIFTRHVDKKHVGTEWGIYRTFTDLGGAFSAAIGGFLAYKFGFTNLFLLVSGITFMGSLFLLGARSGLKKKAIFSMLY